MRTRAIVRIGILALVVASSVVATRPAEAVPHGCASASRDYQAWIDPRAREAGVRVNSGEPCTFRYAEGDTFSGSGRFSVVCATGGRHDQRDVEHDAPIFGAPIPQPCDVGAIVTLDGNHAFTGGAVIGGGPGTVPDPPERRETDPTLADRCHAGPGSATVHLESPVNRSGLFTYRGMVRCDGSTVRITSLTVTPTGGYPFPSAGTASCERCAKPVSVSGTIAGRFGVYEVEMTFEIVTKGWPDLHDTRLGRFVAHWGGEMMEVCPTVMFRLSDSDSAEVPLGESCPI